MLKKIIAVLLVCAFIFTCGCVKFPTGESFSSPVSGGIVEVLDIPGSERVDLDYAISELDIAGDGGLFDINNYTVHEVNGVDVALSGKAKSWIFGIKCMDPDTSEDEKGSVNYLLIYSKYGWKKVAWPGVLPESTVDIQDIITPAQLYEVQNSVIKSNMDSVGISECTLGLSGGIYTVRINSGNESALLRFSAATGEMI